MPGPYHHILINAYGMLYEEVSAASLIKVDLAGNIIDKDEHPYSVNAAGYIIHSAVHEARDDHRAVRPGALGCLKSAAPGNVSHFWHCLARSRTTSELLPGTDAGTPGFGLDARNAQPGRVTLSP